MAGDNLIARIRKGMEVRTSDGTSLGKIRQVWCGSDPISTTQLCDDEVCSRLEVYRRRGRMYVPYSAVADVSGKCVTLNVETEGVPEMHWDHRPAWISADESPGVPEGPLRSTRTGLAGP
jgi:hypothetical protein